MSAEEKTIAKKAAEALAALPKDKQEYMFGFWDGVIAARDGKEGQTKADREEVTPT